MADERTVFFVQRVLQFGNGQVITLPIGTYDSRQAAEKATTARGDTLQEVLRTAHLCIARQTVNGDVELVSTGLKLAQFTADLGIKQVAHGITEIPVHGDIVVPSKRIIIPTH